MVKKVFNINPFFISIIVIYILWQEFLFLLSLKRSWCHALQEKIIVCFAYVYTPFTF